MKTLLVKSFVRALGGVAAMATLPLLQRGVLWSWHRGKHAPSAVARAARQHALALSAAREGYLFARARQRNANNRRRSNPMAEQAIDPTTGEILE